jgi:hypothetical protein
MHWYEPVTPSKDIMITSTCASPPAARLTIS